MDGRSEIGAGESDHEAVPPREDAPIAGRFVVAEVAAEVEQLGRAVLG